VRRFTVPEKLSAGFDRSKDTPAACNKGLPEVSEDRARGRIDRMVRCLFVLLLGLAAFVRLYRLDLANVTGDEGVHGLFAMNIARLMDFPVAGLPSVGIRNSALFLYVLALPYAIVSHPLAGVAFIAALNVLVGWQLYRLTARLYGNMAALVALALWAGAPWQVLYGRQMWPPSLLAVVCLAVLAVAVEWFEKGGQRRLVLLVVAAFVVPQVHFSGFSATVWIASVLIARYRQIRLAPLLAGLAIGLATWIPWLVFQLASNYADLRNLANVGQGKESLYTTAVGAVHWWLTLFGARCLEFWFQPNPGVAAAYVGAAWPMVADVLGLVWSAVLLVAIGNSLAKRDAIARLLALWCILPVGLLLLVRPTMHPHYPLIAYPIPFVMVAAWMCGIVRCRTALLRAADAPPAHDFAASVTATRPRISAWYRGAAVASTLLVVATLATNLAVLSSWFRYVGDDRLTGRGFYQVSYRQRQAVVESILADCPDRVIDLAGMFSGLNPGYYWIYNHEQIRRGYGRFPRDDGRRYWIDELPGDELPPVADVVVEKQWRVGPARVFRLCEKSSGQR
jgi:hypothetical protein